MYLSNKITVVVPCKNEGTTVVETLKLLDEQSLSQKLLVIVADSSTDELTRSLIKKTKFNNIRVRLINGGLPSVARNRGAALAKTPYVLFVDSDIEIRDKFMLSNMIGSIEERDLDLATCKIRTDDLYSLVFWAFDIIRWIFLSRTPFAVGGFMLFKREAFARAGGFNEDDLIAEDYHLSKKISHKKFKIYPYTVHTSSRRFRSKGIFYMIKVMVLCWLNRNDDSFYKRDFNYFT
jgi:glycosyltransferase involved in cell wall biosynthesis